MGEPKPPPPPPPAAPVSIHVGRRSEDSFPWWGWIGILIFPPPISWLWGLLAKLTSDPDDSNFVDQDLLFCQYYHYGPIHRGKVLRTELTTDGQSPDEQIDLFVTPVGSPLPPAPGSPDARLTFGHGGGMSVTGPAGDFIVTLHRKTNHRPGGVHIGAKEQDI